MRGTWTIFRPQPQLPGANDIASGTVNVLESAKVMACWAFKNTVKFLNVTGEEFGLYGSEAYADDASARGEDIRGVIKMDMIGWQGYGIPIPENLDLDSNGPSQWLAERFAGAASKYGTGLVVNPIYRPTLSASDPRPFWQKGWSALLGITDDEGDCGHGGNYPYYHTSNDTIPNGGDPSFFLLGREDPGGDPGGAGRAFQDRLRPQGRPLLGYASDPRGRPGPGSRSGLPRDSPSRDLERYGERARNHDAFRAGRKGSDLRRNDLDDDGSSRPR